MNLIDKIALVGQRMKSEQISLKESLLASSRVSVSDDSVEGVDRLIYNHCLNKKISPTSLENLELPSIKFSLISKKKGWWVNLFIRTKTTFIPAGMSRILWMPLGYPRYRDYYQSRTIIVQNHKGGTGKSTTSVALAVAAALDLQLNARVLVIE